MKYWSLILFFIMSCLFLSSCGEKKQAKREEIARRDTSITRENSYSELFMDSTAVTDYISKHPMHDSLANRVKSFYNQRNFQYAWFFPNGLADYVHTFLSLQNEYIHYSGDSTLYEPELPDRIDSLQQLSEIDLKSDYIRDTEVMLTQQFFRYAYKAYSGDRQLNLRELNWFIPRRKLNTVAFLDSLVKNKGQNLDRYEPVSRQYSLLREKLVLYYGLDKKNTEWEPIAAEKKPLKEGDSSAVISTLQKRLFLLGDLETSDTSGRFDASLTKALKNFQVRHGLAEDGKITKAVLQEINVPVRERIRQILINLERIRWVPEEPTTDYILVNIPEFRLHVYEKGNLAFNMDVVVGSTAHSTVIFSGKLNQVVFSPYWNIPPSILKNEILPGIRKNPNYLARHNMEWNGNAVRQKPGKNNSLGLVKFLFPNSYNIYFHDTPAKSLFGESSRAFSHGCIRLSEPKKLAEFLLRRDSTWTTSKITAAMNAGKEKYVRLKGESEVPVFIGYFTSWVDREGRLNFRKDIYNHDKKMGARLFSAPAVAAK